MIVYVDMDNVMCDFNGAKKRALKENPGIEFPHSQVDFFRKLEPIYGMKDALKSFIDAGIDVYILTAPSTMNPMSYIEKIDSLFLADGSVNPKKIQKHDPMVLLFWTFLIMIFLYRLSRRFNGNGLGRGGNAFPPFIILGSGGFGNHNRWGGGGGGLSGGGGASGDW
jgi:hypothetical protein